MARIDWTDPDGHCRAFILDAELGLIGVENPPRNAPQVNNAEANNTIDKMLKAVWSDWDIRALQIGDGQGVISWDRASHGNRPAVVRQDRSTIAFYYEAPEELRIDRLSSRSKAS